MESVKDGLKIYDNPVGVMSNSPGFGFYLLNLANCMSLSRSDPENRFAEGLALTPYSRGIGAAL